MDNLTLAQVKGFLALATEQNCEWNFTGSGKNDFDGARPWEAGVYEIWQDPSLSYMEEPGFPATAFELWTPDRKATLISVDPRCEPMQTMCGGGFRWRGRLINGKIEPFVDQSHMTLGHRSPVTLHDEDDEEY